MHTVDISIRFAFANEMTLDQLDAAAGDIYNALDLHAPELALSPSIQLDPDANALTLETEVPQPTVGGLDPVVAEIVDLLMRYTRLHHTADDDSVESETGVGEGRAAGVLVAC